MEYLKISNELISEVLECNCTNSKIIDNELIYEAFGDSYINIYEFAFKCKEWAMYKYNITISSSLYKNYAKCWDIDNDKSYKANTEIEAIIKACEYVLSEVNK